jgi:hypothetical protein
MKSAVKPPVPRRSRHDSRAQARAPLHHCRTHARHVSIGRSAPCIHVPSSVSSPAAHHHHQAHNKHKRRLHAGMAHRICTCWAVSCRVAGCADAITTTNPVGFGPIHPVPCRRFLAPIELPPSQQQPADLSSSTPREEYGTQEHMHACMRTDKSKMWQAEDSGDR